MNLNAKSEVEEEQMPQYVNRFAINIPSTGTAFNLNLLNPGLGNQSYILNPVTSVGQNIVTYQPSMGVQSYIALSSEAEDNIIQSLPVGVPLPVGLPVSSELIQNQNFVNAGIIIEDEECNSPGAFQSLNNIKLASEIKMNHSAKPLEESSNNNVASVYEANGLNSFEQVKSELFLKKPCPLEMSIKAANIDMEFEKCDTEVSVFLDSKVSQIKNEPITIQNMACKDESKKECVKVPLQQPSLQLSGDKGSKQSKTEITWENNNVKNKVMNDDFQESLICEVEEVDDDDNDDDDVDDDDDDDDGGGDGDENDSQIVKTDAQTGHICGTDENNSEVVRSIHNYCTLRSKSDGDAEAWSSSDGSDTIPLSVTLKLKKLPNNKSNELFFASKKSKKNWMEDNAKKKKWKNSENKMKLPNCDFQWSESDDDVLNIKRAKNEKNFSESKIVKGAIFSASITGSEIQKFVRVRSCCSKKECGKKISTKHQKALYKRFIDLKSTAEKDAYLANCIERVQKNKNQSEEENTKESKAATVLAESEEKKLVVNSNIQLEIENESNGNQKLSDEIEKAIKESLKDCIVNESYTNDLRLPYTHEKNSWNFFVEVDGCRKKVCLQFLLRLFRITKNRIKQLQKKILSGSHFVEETTGTKSKPSGVWELAKSHLNELLGEECENCKSEPKHRSLLERRSKEDLFVHFKEYCSRRTGKEPPVKFASYKRFLDRETIVSFASKKENSCARCEGIIKSEKIKTKVRKTSNGGKEAKCCKRRRKTGKSEADIGILSSDDEPLVKRKRLKLILPLRPGNKKSPRSTGKRSCKAVSTDKKSREKRKEEKNKGSASRGKDVWSLMLLHLETMPFKECKTCVGRKKHRFLDPTLTTQALFEEYRKYFLKETNSELGLGFTMYEKYFTKNCNYSISESNSVVDVCPRCADLGTKS